jgi:hypothetical protein
MWPTTLIGRRNKPKCPHQNVEITSTAGIRRRLCLDCGNVSLSDSSEVPEEHRLEGSKKES